MDLQSGGQSAPDDTADRRRSGLAAARGARHEPGAKRIPIGSTVKALPSRHYFTDQAAGEWTKIGDRHRLRDEHFLRVLSQWFRPGPILEIGAATGHLSDILRNFGYDVLASDYSPALVHAIEARGIPAAIVDATNDIRSQTGRLFANVLAQNVLPLIWRDRDVVSSTLAAIHDALLPGGRVVCISAHARGGEHPESYFRPREQLEIAQATDLFRLLTAFPHQVIPTDWYRPWNAGLLNFLDFHAAQIFSIRLVWVMEKK